MMPGGVNLQGPRGVSRSSGCFAESGGDSRGLGQSPGRAS